MRVRGAGHPALETRTWKTNWLRRHLTSLRLSSPPLPFPLPLPPSSHLLESQLPPARLWRQFGSGQSLDRLGRRGGHEGRFSARSLPDFSAGGHFQRFWRSRDVHGLTLSIRHFLCRTRASSTLQDALQNGLERLSRPVPNARLQRQVLTILH